MGVTVVDSLAQFKEIINSDKPSVFDFWATWCGPCKQISPLFARISEATPDVGFYKVDIDEVPDVAQEVGVRAMPTFIAFKSGAKIGELVGANPPQLESLIRQVAQ